MRKRSAISVCLLLLFTIAGGALWMSVNSSVKGNSRTETLEDGRPANPFVRVNQRAHAARGGDPQAVRDLGREIVESLAPQGIPATVQEAIADRVTRTELSYRSGGRKGVSEYDVVNAVNSLVTELGAPEFAKTRRDQVRILRIGLMSELPALIDREEVVAGRARARREVGDKINTEMSPLEATAVTLTLLQQKLTNDEFQVKPHEFANNFYQKRVEAWRTRGNSLEARAEHKKSKLLDDTEKSQKRSEMEQVVGRNLDKLPGLADSSLDVLGIDR